MLDYSCILVGQGRFQDARSRMEEAGTVLRRLKTTARIRLTWLKDVLIACLPVRPAIVLEFLVSHHRLPHLHPPVTFCEKIVRRKMVDRDPRLPRLQDKILVKEYAARLLGNDWVVPNLWTGERLPPRSERDWPIPFVIKANHGCGWNYFVRSENELDWDRIETLAEQWMRSVFGRHLREWHYAQIQPRLLVEPFMGCGEAAPPDYKFHVFDGRTAFIQVDLDRLQNHRQLFYDPQWTRLPYWYACPRYDEVEARPPASLAEMMCGAEALASGFAYLRVDLYEIHGKPKLGELTFCPGAGRIPFKPASAEYELGRLWPDSPVPIPGGASAPAS